ncbi:putative DNA-binding protein hexbp [Rosellinia necatrix]|uniref:Putative DNA-binding protein hexbp n=1 Tax=Rosellinia necatrix TaxID=77044 RepID=A0A1W2TII4_ROSNE|nr:putative DNA-binding protein hexbp [Rosellinia necatrix]
MRDTNIRETNIQEASKHTGFLDILPKPSHRIVATPDCTPASLLNRAVAMPQEGSMQHPPFAGWAAAWHDGLNTKHRYVAIRTFGKAMVDPAQWRQSWEEGGGTAGILHLLSSASVTEVKSFCDVIKACNRRGRKSSERERAVEELVMALLPQHFPSTVLRTRDQRPLHKFYSRMLRGCSSAFIENILNAQDHSNPLFQKLDFGKLLFAHEEMLKRRLVNYLVHEGPQLSQSEIDASFQEFVFREPPYPGTQQHISASMQFALELLQARTTSATIYKRWPSNITELNVLMSVYRRFVKKSRSADKTFLIRLGFQLIMLRPDLKSSDEADVLWTAVVALWKKQPRVYEDLLSQGIFMGIRASKTAMPMIATRWKENPDEYEQLLVHALRYGLGGVLKEMSEGYLKTINSLPRAELSSELRWRLLRLYCQHIPPKGIDIETALDFKCLANQEWSFEVVDKLEIDHAVLFLSRLYESNPHFDFLRAPSDYVSIYSMRHQPRPNFNVELLLTSHRRGDADAQQRARDEVDQLRKKAATSREQEDRAIFAKASAHYAIATGDPEVYAETLVWQQRFIRDPLTVQSIFARDAILTVEGIALLSGITLSPTECTTVSQIQQQLGLANQMLEQFNAARRMASKEPSYDYSTWGTLQSLYTDVYNERVSRAKKVKLQPDEPNLDMFHIIWEGTTGLIDSIGSDFLREVSGSIRDLLDGVSGPSLIAASETLLDSAAKWGEKEERNQDQDDISDDMEQLAYQVVSKLAHSDTPILARDLIRRAVIEHPEASSWHRQFLSIGYMRNLPAEAAKTMLLSFAAAIGEKLEEQSYVRVGEEEPLKSAPPRSLIKVSTAKYLAQLLNHADFISPDSAVEVLIELFKAATHIDVRLAVLGSLLSTLNAILGDVGEKWKSNSMVEKILNTLDSVVYIAGNVNERRPISDMDWEEAKEKATVPATSEDSKIPPLFGAILSLTSGEQYSNFEKLQGELFSRLVLPTLRHSQKQHRKWLTLFLAKHRPSLNLDILPHVPITPRIWNYLLNRQGHLLPPTVINEYNQYILLQLRMPGELKDFNKSLRNDVTLRNDASVQHWLAIFDETQSRSWHGRIQNLLNLIVSPIEKASPIADLMGTVISQASVLLDDYENRMEEWSHLVTSLGPTCMKNPNLQNHNRNKHNEGTNKAWDHWREAVLPLAQKLITLVEEKMASNGQNGAMLPSTIPLRLWCLPYPDPRSGPHGQSFRDVAVALEQSLSSFLQSNEGDVLLWTTLVDDTYATLASIYTAITHRLYLALHIGDLDSRLDTTAVTAMQLIKVTVALKFVDSAADRGALRKLRVKNGQHLEKSIVGELVNQLRPVMERWGKHRVPGNQAPLRDMLLRWKGRNNTAWEDICSWDPTYKKRDQSP